MRSIVPTIAILLVMSTCAHAEYIVILASLKKTIKPPQGNQQLGGAAGVAGALGAQGGALGQVGGPPGGQLGISGGIPPGGQLGISGGTPPGGQFGISGSVPPGAQLGFGGGGPPGAQFGDGGGIPPGGALGTPPGVPPGGGFGELGGPGGMVGQPRPEQPLRVMAVVETAGKPRIVRFGQSSFVSIQHKWGRTTLTPQKGVLDVQFLRDPTGKFVLSASKRFEIEQKKLAVVKNVTIQQRLDLARWALEHGLLTPYQNVMDELAKNEEGKKDHRVAAYLKAKATVEQSASQNQRAGFWKQMLFDSYKIATSSHYVLLHREANAESPEVKARLKQLEHLFAGMHFWFAMKGKVLPAPKKKMLTVLISGGQEPGEAFHNQNRIFGGDPLYTDSFFSSRHRLVALSSTRLDEPYQLLTKLSEPVWEKYDRHQILKSRLPGGMKGLNMAVAQTYGLLLTALEEDSQIAAVTHDGARQILVASGLIPHNVLAPKWIQFGIGSAFEIPVGSPWMGYGTPNWVYHFSYKELHKQKKLTSSSYKLLKEVITDSLFAEKGDKGKSKVKARATAWALTHYLMDQHLDGMMKYFQELSRLPRDLDLSEEVLLKIFARSFDCFDATTQKPDDRKLSRLARNWQTAMSDVTLDGEKILSEIYAFRNELQEELAKDKKPTRPGTGTGGFPPGSFPPGTFPPGGGGSFPPGSFPPGGGGSFPPGGGGSFPPGGALPGFGGGAPGGFQPGVGGGRPRR